MRTLWDYQIAHAWDTAYLQAVNEQRDYSLLTWRSLFV